MAYLLAGLLLGLLSAGAVLISGGGIVAAVGVYSAAGTVGTLGGALLSIALCEARRAPRSAPRSAPGLTRS